MEITAQASETNYFPSREADSCASPRILSFPVPSPSHGSHSICGKGWTVGYSIVSQQQEKLQKIRKHHSGSGKSYYTRSCS